jgi:hypothetical protein
MRMEGVGSKMAKGFPSVGMDEHETTSGWLIERARSVVLLEGKKITWVIIANAVRNRKRPLARNRKRRRSFR